MATDIVACACGWIGTPYQNQASLRGVGCDCLGLLRGVWREVWGDEPQAVPAYTPDWSDATGAQHLRDALAVHMDKVALDALAPGDVALFAMLPGAAAKHCGIVAEQNGALTLIHARQNRRVAEEIFSPLWRARLRYGYRLTGLVPSQTGC